MMTAVHKSLEIAKFTGSSWLEGAQQVDLLSANIPPVSVGLACDNIKHNIKFKFNFFTCRSLRCQSQL